MKIVILTLKNSKALQIMSQVFIHPGFYKSGTTTLQDHLFKKNENIKSIGRPFTDDTLELIKTISVGAGQFDIKRTHGALEKLNLLDHDGPIVLSDEKLADVTFQNEAIVYRLKEIFPEAKILFTIRNQITAIPSFYSNHGRMLKRVPEPYNGKHIEFDDWFEHGVKYQEISYIGLARYAQIIKLYSDVFGKESVRVFLFEELVKDIETFSKKLGDFLGLETSTIIQSIQGQKSNKRGSAREVKYKAFRERFLPNFHPTKYIPYGSKIRETLSSFLNRGKSVEVDLSSEQLKLIHNLYMDNNKYIKEEFDLDLQKWKYPL